MTTKKTTATAKSDLYNAVKSSKSKEDLITAFVDYFDDKKETKKLVLEDYKWFKNFIGLNSNHLRRMKDKDDKFDVSDYKSFIETLENQYNDRVRIK